MQKIETTISKKLQTISQEKFCSEILPNSFIYSGHLYSDYLQNNANN